MYRRGYGQMNQHYYTDHYTNKGWRVTDKIIRVEEVVVPDLNGEAWRKVHLGLVKTVKVLLETRSIRNQSTQKEE